MIYSTYVQTCNIHNTYIIIYTLYKCTVNIYMIRYIYSYIYTPIDPSAFLGSTGGMIQGGQPYLLRQSLVPKKGYIMLY